MQESLLLIVGSLSEGFQFYGPFQNEEELETYANDHNIHDYEWMTVVK